MKPDPEHVLGSHEPADPTLPPTGESATIPPRPHEPQPPTSEATSPSIPNRRSGSRYRVVKPHARGGLGEIFVAHDDEIGREVALKEIQTRFGGDAESRSRFIKEAEVTGKLEHPGIVPIYGLGKYSDGRPYYAMRFIRGESLKDAIDQLHDPNRNWAPGERELELRKLLRRFIDVCNAVGYAHSRGVLHRDLKPDNVMLGRFGETLVVDWGLARVGNEATPESITEKSFSPVAVSDSSQTQQGQLLGTPSFMSPEQGSGLINELGPTSDVYSLGATLYTLLTGKASVTGNSLGELLARLQSGEIVPPRELRSDVPPALNSICLHALELRPDDRYPTAQALAEDLESWLADESVAAHRESPAERLRRWVKSHRTLVASALALTATAVVALVVGLLAVSAEQRRTEQRRSEADTARLAEAEQRLLAERQRDAAEEAKRNEAVARAKADAERDRAQWTAYLTHLQAADAEWERNRTASAFAHLEACDPKFRGWEHGYLQRMFRRGYIELNGLPSLPQNMTFAIAPQGKLIAFATDNGKLMFVDPTTMSVSHSPDWSEKVDGPLSKLEFDSSGDRLLAGSSNGTIRIVSKIGALIRRLEVPESDLNAASFSPDGARIVTTQRDGAIHLWNTESGELTATFPDAQQSLGDAAFSPDGRHIAVARFKEIVIRDASDGAVVATLRGHTGTVDRVRYTPDGKRLVSTSDDLTIRVWNLETAQVTDILRGHTRRIGPLAMTRDGRRIATSGLDATVRVWDLATGEELHRFRGHLEQVTSLGFVPDGSQLMSGARDRSVKIWDLVRGQGSVALANLATDISSVAFFERGESIFVGAYSSLSFRDQEGKRLAAIGGFPDQVRSFPATGISLGRKRLAAGSTAGVLLVWDVLRPDAPKVLRSHQGSINRLAFSPDGNLIATAGADGAVKIWDLAAGEYRRPLVGHKDAVTTVEFSCDGSRMVSGGLASELKVWSTADARELFSLVGLKGSVGGATFSRDGRWIAGASSTGEVKIWNAADGKLLHNLAGHDRFAKAVTFSPDGKRLVSAGSDQTIKLWDTTTGDETLTLRGHTAGVGAVAFSDDGLKLISGDETGSIRVWNAAPLSVR